jgi:hypothetical protein
MFGEVCLQAWQRNPRDFGREVMDILETRFGRSPLEEALSAPIVPTQRQLATVSS